MEEKTKSKSEYSAKVEEIAKQLMALVESQKENADEVGIILISYNVPKEDDHAECIMSVTGTRNALTHGLAKFATNGDTEELFKDTAAAVALSSLMNSIKNKR